MLNDEQIKELKKEFFGNDNHLIITPISEIFGEDLIIDYDNSNNEIKYICKDDEILKLNANLLEENEFDDFIKSNNSNEDDFEENIINEHIDFAEENNQNIKVVRDYYQNELREID